MSSKESIQPQQPIHSLRKDNQTFHGYVEDQSGAGKTSADIEIKPLNLSQIECGLGSTATRLPDHIHPSSVNYPEPFSSRAALGILTKLTSDIDGLELDPDQVIVRSSLEKIIAEVLDVIPAQSAERISPNTSPAELISRAQNTNPAVFLIDHQTDIAPEQLKQLISSAEIHGHLVVKVNGQSLDENQSDNLIQIGEHQIDGTDSIIGYAIISKPVLEIYNPHRMVFMLPQYRLEKTGNHTSPEIIRTSRQAIIDINGLRSKPEQILMAEGSYDALDQTLKIMGKLGIKNVIGRGSHFPYIKQLANRHFLNYKAESSQNPLDQTGSTLELAAKISKNDLPPSVIYLDVPSNPTGFVDNLKDITTLIEAAKSKGHVVFVDCAYGDLLPEYQDLLNLANTHHNVVTFASFSKNRHMAGERLGYANLPPHLTAHINMLNLMPQAHITQSGLDKLQNLAAINQESFIISSRQEVEVRKQALIDSLSAIPEVRIAKTDPAVSIIYVDLQFENYSLSVSVGQLLQQRYGVNCEPGEEFTVTDSGLGPTGFRLRIPPQIEDSVEIANRLEGLIAEIKNLHA